LLAENGKHRKSKASKGKRKLKQCRCKSCGEIFEYSPEDIIKVSNMIYVECKFCCKEITLK